MDGYGHGNAARLLRLAVAAPFIRCPTDSNYSGPGWTVLGAGTGLRRRAPFEVPPQFRRQGFGPDEHRSPGRR